MKITTLISLFISTSFLLAGEDPNSNAQHLSAKRIKTESVISDSGTTNSKPPHNDTEMKLLDMPSEVLCLIASSAAEASERSSFDEIYALGVTSKTFYTDAVYWQTFFRSRQGNNQLSKHIKENFQNFFTPESSDENLLTDELKSLIEGAYKEEQAHLLFGLLYMADSKFSEALKAFKKAKSKVKDCVWTQAYNQVLSDSDLPAADLARLRDHLLDEEKAQSSWAKKILYKAALDAHADFGFDKNEDGVVAGRKFLEERVSAGDTLAIEALYQAITQELLGFEQMSMDDIKKYILGLNPDQEHVEREITKITEKYTITAPITPLLPLNAAETAQLAERFLALLNVDTQKGFSRKKNIERVIQELSVDQRKYFYSQATQGNYGLNVPHEHEEHVGLAIVKAMCMAGDKNAQQEYISFVKRTSQNLIEDPDDSLNENATHQPAEWLFAFYNYAMGFES